jgi:outer membrane protein
MIVLKRFALLLLILPIFGLLSQPGLAQTKVGYIDASKLLKRMPEAVDAEARLGQLVGQWTHDADDIQNELNRKSGEFDRRKLIMTDAERTAFEVDLQNLHKKLDDFKQEKYGQTGELYTQQAQLMKPAYEKLQKAIEEAARDGSYDYVIDRSARDVTMLYANAKYDLTIVVAHKLNLDTDALTQPLLNNGTPPMNGQPPQQRPNAPNAPTDPSKQQPIVPNGGVQPIPPPVH